MCDCPGADSANLLHRNGTGSDFPYNDAFKSAANDPFDCSEYLRGIDPSKASAALESYSQSTFDFSAELLSNLQETGSGQLESEVEEGSTLGT